MHRSRQRLNHSGTVHLSARSEPGLAWAPVADKFPAVLLLKPARNDRTIKVSQVTLLRTGSMTSASGALTQADAYL
jgi:hypothetical protein